MAENIVELLTDVADAIREKKGTSELINAQDFAEEIKNLPSGGGDAPIVEEKDVNFYDYEGTLLYAYTLEEARALTELPTPKGHEGLTFQGWNWDYEDVIALDYPMDIGAMYITDDGKTRLYLTIAKERAKKMYLQLYTTTAGTFVIDWGDGIVENYTTSGYLTFTHEYAELGEYVIAIERDTTWRFGFAGTTSNVVGPLLAPSSERIESLKMVAFGSNVDTIGNNAFQYCGGLQSVVIPQGVTSIGNNVFQYCGGLQSVVIPQGVTSIGINAFQNCGGLQSVVIPQGVTSIGINAFQNCGGLQSVVIPQGVTSIGNNVFQNCGGLQSVVIPQGVTSIGNNAFQNCGSLQSVVIPQGVTSIGNYAFYSIVSAAYIDFSTCDTIPALTSSASIGNLNAGTVIIVPDALYDQWIVATNWATHKDRIVKDSEYTRPL